MNEWNWEIKKMEERVSWLPGKTWIYQLENTCHLICSHNSSKFCALPGGYRGKGEDFRDRRITYLSSSTEGDKKGNDIWRRGIRNADSTIMKCGLYKGHGLYVRLIKD